MLQNFYADDATKGGIIGGTGLIFLYHISVDDVVKTVVLTCIGAAVSFCISLALKFVVSRWRK